jgi:chromosome segregation ATPase
MVEKIQVSEEELFQVLEKKLMDLLSEREDIIRENRRLSQEIADLTDEKRKLIEEKRENVQKLEVLISLFNSDAPNVHVNAAVGAKPILVQAT